MPDVAEQPSRPPRTWRPMVLWTAGILLVLGGFWLAAAVLDIRRTHQVVLAFDKAIHACMFNYGPSMKAEAAALEQLGGKPRAVRRLRFYFLAPGRFCPLKVPAVQLLGGCGTSAVPTLRLALRSQDDEVRRSAAYSLGRLGPDAAEAVPDLLACLADDVAGVRRVTAATLGLIGPPAGPAIPRLIVIVRDDPDTGTVCASMDALVNLSAETEAAVPALVAALKGEVRSTGPERTGGIMLFGAQPPNVPAAAAQCLGRLGPAAKASVPALEAAQGAADEDVRAAAAEALQQIRGEEPPK